MISFVLSVRLSDSRLRIGCSWSKYRTAYLSVLKADSTISVRPGFRPERASIELREKKVVLSFLTLWIAKSIPHNVICWHGKYLLVLEVVNDKQSRICAYADNAPVRIQRNGTNCRLSVSILNPRVSTVSLTREHRLVHMCTASFLMGRICTILRSPNLFRASGQIRTNLVFMKLLQVAHGLTNHVKFEFAGRLIFF